MLRKRIRIQLYILTSFLRLLEKILKSDEGQALLAIHSITQAVPDIWRKLQKLGAEPQTPQATSVSEGFKLLNNWDQAEKKRRVEKRKKKKGANFSCHNAGTISR